VTAVRNALAVTAELEARSYILHLPCPGISEEDKGLDAWQDFSRQSLQAIFDDAGPMGRICIENLDYPIRWYAPLLKAFGLKMCLDVGHLVCQHLAPVSVLKHYRETISVIHLHGVEDGRDHLALGPDRGIDMPSLVKLLQNFRESLCIEVFAYTHLADSLAYFEKHWRRAAESARGDRA
jgi:sugar phosphate isomerase/epimerase